MSALWFDGKLGKVHCDSSLTSSRNPELCRRDETIKYLHHTGEITATLQRKEPVVSLIVALV